MAKLENLDPTTPMFAQFKEKTGPIVLANTFVVPKDKSESFLAHFKKQAEFMKSQPGFVSLQMRRDRPARDPGRRAGHVTRTALVNHGSASLVGHVRPSGSSRR